MKHALIRLLTIMTLASSLSAFAISDKAKTAASSEPTCAPASQTAQTAGQNQGQRLNDQQQSRQQLIKQQEEQWLHDTQYIPAG